MVPATPYQVSKYRSTTKRFRTVPPVETCVRIVIGTGLFEISSDTEGLKLNLLGSSFSPGIKVTVEN